MTKKFVIIAFLIIARLSFAQDLTNNQIKEITDKIPELISKNYVFKEKGEIIVKDFGKLVATKKYFAFKNPDSLAVILSKDLKQISNDGHMYVKTKQNEKSDSNLKSWKELEKENESLKNYGFMSVQILEGNIGYIKIIEFMHPKRSMATAIAAMKLVENTEKLIIDVRKNGGGYPGIMLYILNHYFDGPPTLLSTTYSSDTKENSFTTYTSDLVYGKLRVDTPLFILTDRETASAAEFFAYTAKAFNKAIIIGETSAGAAHMNEFYELPNNFRISISVMAPINPKTESNWEVKGVEPNYKVERDISIKELVKLIEKIK